MTPHMRWGLIGVIIGLILFIWNPIAAVILLVLAIAVPVVLYRMLSPDQRRRLREQRRRRQIGN
jgi:membrane protein implicated in regulation of membrane protease activity